MELLTTIAAHNYRYLTIGTGKKKLLFLYGLASYKESFTKLLTESFPDYTVIVPDYPDHNNFIDAGVAITCIADLVQYLVPLITQEMAAEPFDVVGFSLGGLVALELAQLPASLVRKTVVWASPVGAQQSLTGLMHPLADFYQKSAVIDASLDKFNNAPAVKNLLLTRGAKPLSPVAFRNYLKAICSFTMPQYVKDTLFVYAADDPLVSAKNITYLHAMARGHNVHVVEVHGGGHLGTKTGRTKALSAIKEYLKV